MEIAFFLTLLAGFIGGIVALKLKIPGGSLIGALVLSIVYNVWTGNGFFYDSCADILRFITGVYLGTRINRATLVRLKSVWKAALVMMIGLLMMNMIVGSILSRICDLDIGTAIMASAPGGMTELSLYASDIGADVSTVATLQVVRVLANIGLMPIIIRSFAKKQYIIKLGKNNKKMWFDDAGVSRQLQNSSFLNERKEYPIIIKLIVMFLGALAGVVIFEKIGVPSSLMIGAMVGTLFANIGFGEVQFPSKTGATLQMFTGAYVGTTVSKKQLVSLMSMIPGVILMVISFLVCTVILGVLIYRLLNIDIGTAMFACAPGGISDMALIAIDMGADIAVIVSMHTIRLITLIVVIPYMISILKFFPV